jgi:pimeloyl-ACP methyl ester carboxylesterase
MRRGYVETRHGQVHYCTAGDGAPLLLLHASPRSSRSFANLIPLLADRYRVVAADTLGFGNSDPLPGDASIAMLAESMADLIDALEMTPTAVFGLHTGNKIGAALAAGFPDHVSRYILSGMTHSIIPEQSRRDACIKALLAANPIRPEDVEAHSEKLDRLQGIDGFARIYDANYAFDLAAEVQKIDTPSLVLELATPLEAHLGRQAPALAALMPRAESRVLEFSDRELLERRPERLAEAISDFLAD